MSNYKITGVDKYCSHIDINIAVVVSSWYKSICDNLLEGCSKEIEKNGILNYTILRVCGAIEIPIVIQSITKKHDAIVALGVVVKGLTPHFDYVCKSVMQGLMNISLNTFTPVSNGILTVHNELQAAERANLLYSSENKGTQAAIAALSTVYTLRSLNYGKSVYT